MLLFRAFAELPKALLIFPEAGPGSRGTSLSLLEPVFKIPIRDGQTGQWQRADAGSPKHHQDLGVTPGLEATTPTPEKKKYQEC